VEQFPLMNKMHIKGGSIIFYPAGNRPEGLNLIAAIDVAAERSLVDEIPKREDLMSQGV
jgi:hypothetical protein